jgi:hypothetical protein
MLSLLPCRILLPEATTTCAGRACTGQAGRGPTNAAERRQLLNNVVSRVEIKVAGLDAALQSYGGVSAVGRDDAAIITGSKVEGKVPSRLPAVLKIHTANSTWTFCNKHVSPGHRVGVVEEKVGQACDTLPTLSVALIVTAWATATSKAAMVSVWKFGVANVSV